MGLFENLPFTNFENLNLDMIVKDISTMKSNEEYLNDKVNEIEDQIGDFNIEELEGRVDALEASDTAQNTEINSIKDRVHDLEASDTAQNTEIASIKTRLTTAEGNIQNNAEDIDTNDQASRGRDDALSARIANLERATIHDIYNYYGSKNLILFGSDLRALPASCRDADGYPFEWGNKYNQRFSVGTETPRSFIYSDARRALIPNPDTTSYDYYQLGKLPSNINITISPTFPITLTIGVGSVGVITGKYQHTFQSMNEVWTIGTNCQIKTATFNISENPIYGTMWLMGTPENWRTLFGNDNGIIFAFLEYGSGSIDISGDLPFDIKDREFFGHDATPTLQEAVITGQVTEDASVTYYDLVGEPQTITSQIIMTANLKKYGKVVDGYINVRMNLRNNTGNVLARGAQFTLTGLAMTYDAGVNAPMPDLTSPLRGTANDSKYYEWNYNNTQNTYLFVNISNDGTWNLKLLSGGMRNYTGASDTYTEFRIPIHYIAS